MGILKKVYAKVESDKFRGVTKVSRSEGEPLKAGDSIRCRSETDMIEYMQGLARAGVTTDWEPEETAKGLWILHVKEVK